MRMRREKKNAKGFADRQKAIYLSATDSPSLCPEKGSGTLIQGLTGGLFGCLDDAFQDRPVREGDAAAQPLQRGAGSPREFAQTAGGGGLAFRPGPAPEPRA